MRCSYSLSSFTLPPQLSFDDSCVCLFAVRFSSFASFSFYRIDLFIYLQRRKKMNVYLLWINGVKSGDLKQRHRQTRQRQIRQWIFRVCLFIFISILLPPQHLCARCAFIVSKDRNALPSCSLRSFLASPKAKSHRNERTDFVCDFATIFFSRFCLFFVCARLRT